MSGIKSILFLLITSLTFIKSSAQQSNANTVPARRIDAVEANPEKRWKTRDFDELCVDASTARRQFKKRFDMISLKTKKL